ncbi:CBF/Mak21 family-domain-containing protein [Tricladium varicosporioides]|nr:CBF/Mak21 family-domain-containing protein [Hymenoscyphus varicosporioides]
MPPRDKKSVKGTKKTAKAYGDGLSFDDQALSALTAKIEQGLANGKTPEKVADAPNKKEKKRKSENRPNVPQQQSKANESEPARGTKRDSSGNAKMNGKTKGQNKKESMKIATSDDARSILLQEILALGGTEEDLDLVANATSDEEDNTTTSTPQLDKALQKELAKFVAGLGIEGQTGVDAIESDEEEDGHEETIEGEGEWEEASDIGSDPSEVIEEVEIVKKNPKVAPVEMPSPENPNRLIFEARPDWHAAPLPDLPIGNISDSQKYATSLRNIKDYAKTLLEADGDLYASKNLSSTSSHRFLSTIMASGTLSDKVSALTLVVQESPIHTTKSFENLLALARKRSRAQAVSAPSALKDLLGNGVVLPADRRLRLFANQPGLLGTLQEDLITNWQLGHRLPGDITKAHLISWAYEDWLKESYFEMLKVLEGWCNDEVLYARTRAVTYVYELLKEKPEQEANLLRLLVNKLGDPDKKIASRTSYLLLQLQTSHPLMKPIIIRSIETELLLRPGQSSHAKYYAINTLNQTILSASNEEIAKKLLDIYFEIFVTLLKKPDPQPTTPTVVTNRKGQVQGGGAPMGKKAKARAAKEEEAKLSNQETTEKMISAVLTGVNRAFPFSKADDTSLEKHMDTLFRITHSSNFNTSIQALMLIEQLATTKHLAVERFYRTLYESLLDPRLITTSKHALYLNLLFRALRADINIKRVKAFAKRLLQIVTLHEPPFICGVIYLLRELEVTFPGLKTLFSDPEMNDDDEEVFRDVPEDEEENALKQTEGPRIKRADVYDGRKRDPEHSNADKSCLWESIPFLVHFHPSVSLFASRLSQNAPMPPKPDLASHGLSHFLDRFVYRNAKAATSGPKGSSIMQPLAGSDNKSILLTSKSSQASLQPVNTEAFSRKKAEDVAVDEVFFHKYFSQIGKGKQTSNKKKPEKKLGSDDEDEENDEDEIWQALVESRPEVEGASDDSDMEMLDLDDSDMETSDSDSEVDVESDGGAPIIPEDEASGSGLDDEEMFPEGSNIEEMSEDDEEALFAKELQVAVPAEEGEERESSRKKRRRLKNLPTFASMEDYAAMIDKEDDEDL